MCAVVGSLLFGTAFFGAALFSGNFATSGDGYTQALPTYLGSAALWEPDMMFGYPLFADPNQAHWYPILALCRALHAPFNLYVALPYVIASVGVIGFVRSVTGSVAGGVVASLTFCLGGFMISHQGHLNLIHPAAWTPYIFWSIERFKRSGDWRTMPLGSLAVGVSALGGSEQPLAYAAAVAVCYATLCVDRAVRLKVCFFTASMCLLGAGVAAVGIVPTYEFVTLSTRHFETYADYNVFSVGLSELPVRLFFPYFLGATPSPFYSFSHENVGAFSETSNYVGLVALVLTAIAAFSSPHRRQVAFWGGVAAAALWLSLGDHAFASRIAYHVPIVDMFRIPGRHAYEFSLAVATLAAFGVAALEGKTASTRAIVSACGCVAIPFLGLLWYISVDGNALRTSLASSAGQPQPVPLSLLANPALYVPAGLLPVAVLCVVSWRFVPKRRLASSIGIACVALDMTAFAGQAYWRYSTVTAAHVRRPQLVARVAGLLAKTHQRAYVAPDSVLGSTAPPNLSTLWGLPELGGYVSLESSAVAAALQMDPTGVIPVGTLATTGNSAFDLAAVKYIVLPKAVPKSRLLSEATSGTSLEAFIGADRLTRQKSVSFAPIEPFETSSITVVSELGLSQTIPNGATVATVALFDARGVSQRIDLIAGRDTSEAAFDRPTIRPYVRHARAPVFSSDGDTTSYVARLPLGRPIRVKRVEIHWSYRDPHVGALTVLHLALVDRDRGTSYPFTAVSRFYAEPTHWRVVHDVSPSDLVFENRHARPRVWTVGNTVKMPLDAQLDVVRFGTARSSNGAFDWNDVATTRDISMAARPRSGPNTASLTSAAPTSELLSTRCSRDCLLLLSDLSYPGWRASIDGKAQPVEQVDYFLRGVLVPGGLHRVHVWFAPDSLLVGAALSVASIFVLLLMSIRAKRPACIDTT